MSEFVTDFSEILRTQYEDFKFIGPGDAGRISSILGQNDYHNIVYVGRSGVGKTANLLGLVQSQLPDSKARVSLPLHMINRKFYLLDNSRLFSGDEAQIRANIQATFDYLKRPGKHTLVLEDANDFLNAIDDHGVPGVTSMLMSELRQNSFQCILMVREVPGDNTKLSKVIECHSDMEELFTILRKDIPEKSEVAKIVNSRREILEHHHSGLTIPLESSNEIVDLTFIYPSLATYQREQPARTIRLLDNIASTFLTRSSEMRKDDKDWSTATEELQRLNQRQNELEQDYDDATTELREHTENLKERLMADESYGDTISKFDITVHKTAEMKELEHIISLIVAELETKVQPKIVEINKKINVEMTLDVSDVRSIFSEMSGIPSTDLSDNEAEKTLNIEAQMLSKIFGQDNAVETVVGAIKRAKAGLKAENKPIGGFILLGSSGVGKSFLGEVLAETLFSNKDNMTSFDMSEFMEKHTVSRLIGTTPGYVGYGNGGALTNAVRDRPHQVILLDEIEKAHPDVFKVLLQVLDKGRLSDELGTVDFSNVILLLTTNLAQHLSLDESIDVNDPETRDRVIEELRTIFPQELINRVDDFLLFRALLEEHIEKIVKREVVKINESLAKRTSVVVEISDDDIKELVKDKYKQEEGSRQVLKFIGNHLERKVADIVLRHPEGGKIKATFTGSGFDLSFEGN